VWRGRKLETRQARIVGLGPHRSPRQNRDAQNAEDRPLHAERIRCSWEAGKCVAMGPVVGFGLVTGRAGVEVGVRWDARVAERGPPEGRRYDGEQGGSGSCSCR